MFTSSLWSIWSCDDFSDKEMFALLEVLYKYEYTGMQSALNPIHVTTP